MQPPRTLSVVSAGALLAALAVLSPCRVAAQVVTLLDEQFDFFALGEVWQEHGAGAPELSLGIVELSPFYTILQMHSDGFGDELRGVETIQPISLTGLTNVTVDAWVSPVNMGVNGTRASVEVAMLGSGGGFLRALASNNVGPDPEAGDDWANFLEDSRENALRTPSFVHCFNGGCQSFQRFVLTVHSSGSILDIYHQDETLAFSETSNFRLGDLGDSLTLALRQEIVDGGDEVLGWFDSVVVTTDPNFVIPVGDGDFNGDGAIDGADLLVWQRGESPTPLGADDLALWETGFGGGDLVATAVPEPTNVGWLTLGLAWRRRRTR